jgi:squalene synthase HpnC
VPPGLPAEAEILGRAAGENFTVATRLLPGRARRHLVAFYGYARFVDQLGDAYPGDRVAALDWTEAETLRTFSDPGVDSCHPLIDRAARSALELDLGPDPFLRLVEANRQDQRVTRYETYEDLLQYCSLSADPVGRMVLAAFGVVSGPQIAWSDSICSGLQLVEHWQDVVEDTQSGRIYIPSADMRSFGVDEGELSRRTPPSPQLRALMAFEVSRARSLLEAGRPLLRSLRGRARVAVTGFWTGGWSALDALAAERFDSFSRSPRPRRTSVVARTLLTSTHLTLGDMRR